MSAIVSDQQGSITRNRQRQDIFFNDPRCVPRPWDCSSASSFLFFPSRLTGKTFTSQSEETQTNTWCAPIVAPVCRLPAIVRGPLIKTLPHTVCPPRGLSPGLHTAVWVSGAHLCRRGNDVKNKAFIELINEDRTQPATSYAICRTCGIAFTDHVPPAYICFCPCIQPKNET